MYWLTYAWSESDVKGVETRQSKISDLDLSVAVDQDVGWFEVAVQHHVAV